MSDTLDTVKHATAHDTVRRKMPSKSPEQARLMAAAAHTKGGYGGVPQSTGKEFNQADTGSAQLKQAMKDRNARNSFKKGK
jgi:hypothetical protein